jgi:hypothetical protein
MPAMQAESHTKPTRGKQGACGAIHPPAQNYGNPPNQIRFPAFPPPIYYLYD